MPRISSAELHNRNCFLYLKTFCQNLPKNELQSKTWIKSLKGFLKKDYDPRFKYSKLYTDLVLKLEKMYETGSQKKKEQLQPIIFQLYANDNRILEYTYQETMQVLTHEHSSAGHSLKKTYKNQRSLPASTAHEVLSPEEVESNWNRLKSTYISSTFKPQSLTGVPTERRYLYNQASLQIERRFPTQSQWLNSEARVNPLFDAYLSHLKTLQSDPLKENIDHIYFNFLRHDKARLIGERSNEAKLTSALKTLEMNHTNIAMISLPANDDLMDESAYHKTQPAFTKDKTYDLFLRVVTGKQISNAELTYQDFYISPAIREKLFGQDWQHTQDAIFKEMLDTSFKAVGIDAQSNTQLSKALRQAVWFDFINFQLPYFVINKLNPKAYNFSCKDAIDRGGVASAWYNLRQSFETDQPMSRDEFERGLHAAPIMTKDRPMNDHIHRIWNMVNEYVNANPHLVDLPQKNWLVLWRDMNCPQACVETVLSKRIEDALKKLETFTTYDGVDSSFLKTSKQIVEEVKKQLSADNGEPSQLLEVVGRTMNLFEDAINKNKPSELNRQAYFKLAEKIKPTLGWLAQLMIAFCECLGWKSTTKEAFEQKRELHNQVGFFHTKLAQVFKPEALEVAKQEATPKKT
jgi:hypothetical protein